MSLDPIAEARRRIAHAVHIAVLTGAGISAESGIPTYRGLGGLWQGRDPISLATPEAFRREPLMVWEFYNWRRGLVAAAEPNPGHRALAGLADRVPQLRLITQNVDRLHQRAGSTEVIELHGNLGEVRCSACGMTSDRWDVDLPADPRCDDCGGRLRPGVVWFGEMLPPDAWNAAESAVLDADLVLVVGTSSVVYPAAHLATLAKEGGAFVIEVNPEPTPLTSRIDLAIQGTAGTVLPAIVGGPKA